MWFSEATSVVFRAAHSGRHASPLGRIAPNSRDEWGG